jgi:SAM-dependent methyltransferase
MTPSSYDACFDDLTLSDGLPPPGCVARALRSGTCPVDRLFDRFLPFELRTVSSQYWTPLEAAARAAEWIAELGIRSVLDIGSGPGKFCVAAALAGDARFIGLEQRERLVGAARDLARLFKVEERVRFIHGALGRTALPDAEAFYLFNPFEENLFCAEDCLDQEVELGDARYFQDIALVDGLLREAREGTYLLTYNGFGGQVPECYREVLVDRELPNVLRLWRKAKRRGASRSSPSYSSELLGASACSLG